MIPKVPPLCIFARCCGVTTNNVTQIMGQEKGLHLVLNRGCSKIQITGDSKMIIHIAQKLVDGSLQSNLVCRWRLKSQVAHIKSLLNMFSYVITSHTLRSGNKVVDWLVNWGKMEGHGDFAVAWHSYLSATNLEPGEKEFLSNLLEEDDSSPMGAIKDLVRPPRSFPHEAQGR